MTGITQSAYSDRQILAWLRGLYTVALADGYYDPEERELIGQLTQDLADIDAVNRLEAISPKDLAAELGKETHTAENFFAYGGFGSGSRWSLFSARIRIATSI